MHALNQPIRWLNVTLVMASTWRVACCIVGMLFLRTSMPPSQPSKQSALSSLLIGVPQALKLASTTSLPQLFLVETWQRYNAQSACCPTPLLLRRPGHDLITSSI